MESQIDYPKLQLVLELSTHEEQVQYESTQTLQNAEKIKLKRSFKIRRSAIPSDYVVYLKNLILMSDLKMIQNCFHKP